VLFVGERVDDVQAARGAGERLDLRLPERPDDERGNPALEVARNVLQRLAGAVGELRRKVQRVAPELADRDFEVDTVRSDGFSKSSATCRPASALAVGACRPSRRDAFISAARSSSRRKSDWLRSRTERKSFLTAAGGWTGLTCGTPR
jgi:hypothetical protein